MEKLFSMSFTTPLPPAQMFGRLAASKDWHWAERAAERWGDYLSSTEVPGFPGTSVAVFSGQPEPGRCALNVKFRSDRPDAEARLDSLRKLLLATVIASVEAHDVKESEFLE